LEKGTASNLTDIWSPEGFVLNWGADATRRQLLTSKGRVEFAHEITNKLKTKCMKVKNIMEKLCPKLTKKSPRNMRTQKIGRTLSVLIESKSTTFWSELETFLRVKWWLKAQYRTQRL
jgi:hypothetical protein